MGVTALWTAAHYRIPLLLVIANNRSFYNDEVHQERVARMRHRPVENKWIGQRMTEPDIDLCGSRPRSGRPRPGPDQQLRRTGPSLRAGHRCRRAGRRGRRRCATSSRATHSAMRDTMLKTGDGPG